MANKIPKIFKYWAAISPTNQGRSYWTQQKINDNCLFFASHPTDLLSKVTDEHLLNQVTGSSDYLTITGVGLSARYRTPDTAPYKTADSDNVFWKTDASESTCDGNRLIGYDFPRILVRYLNVAPYTILWIAILKTEVTVTNGMRDAFDLSIWWNNTLSGYGYVKENRGAEKSVWTPEIVGIADADGNLYTEVVIGTQTWLKENLKTTKYRDGTSINSITDNLAWSLTAIPAYCWFNNDSATHKAAYGAIYNYYCAVDVKGICPVGYHIPTLAEINTLIAYLGGGAVAGGHIKEDGTAHWTSDNADNSSGLSAVGGGYRNPTNGTFALLKDYGILWTSTNVDATTANRYFMAAADTAIVTDAVAKRSGHTIMMIKD